MHDLYEIKIFCTRSLWNKDILYPNVYGIEMPTRKIRKIIEKSDSVSIKARKLEC